MTIRWSEVPFIHQNGEITHYTVLYGFVDRQSILEVRVNASDISFEATSLIPGRVYTVEIAASTNQGRGVFSQAIFATTLEESKRLVY